MPRATAVLFDTDGATELSRLELTNGMTVKEPLRRAASFQMSIWTQTKGYELVQKGRYIGVSTDPAVRINRLFRIDQLERSVDSDVVKVSGKDYSGIFEQRICIPPAGQTHISYSAVKAETALKDLVAKCATSPTDGNRTVPNLVLESDAGRGPNVTVQARFQSLSDIIEEILNFAGGGYRVVYTGTSTNQHRLEYIPGVDRTSTVILNTTTDSVTDQTWLQSDVDRRTTVYVAGQGEGVERDLITRHVGGVTQTGLNRREALVDARDIAKGATAALQERGDSVLSSLATDNRHSAVLHQFGSFRYGVHFSLGDIVTVQNKVWGLWGSSRVVSVTHQWGTGSNPSISIELDRPWPNIRDRVLQEAYGMSTVAPKGAVDYHPENHATRHAVGGADVLTPAAIGAALAGHKHLVPYCNLYAAADQTIPVTTWTPILWDSETSDAGNWHSAGDPSAVVLPEAGLWFVYVMFQFYTSTNSSMAGVGGLTGAPTSFMMPNTTAGVDTRIYVGIGTTTGAQTIRVNYYNYGPGTMALNNAWGSRIIVYKIGDLT